ncbi:hypothetical protein H2201_007614 [Coniosporium apollinis]|uniref:Rhodopsin domain-containing protein n=1 Tax=Coniosporium apollinis TaxID=61459 RepID=A0ABQ9NIZ3_9PEZI|nr:hypothetical protein H2201_007614 [Coniosporium apollinis]
MSSTTAGPYIDHHGAAVVAIGYSCIILTLGISVARFWTTIRRKRGFGLDDLTFFIANMVALAQSIVIDRAVQAGLGEHVNALSSSSKDNYFKFFYSAQLLSITAQAFAKHSMLLLIERLDSTTFTLRNCRIIHVLCLAWALFSLFAVAFQCGLPNPWVFDSVRCVAGGSLYYVIIVFNVITDAFIASFFLPVLWKLQMDRATRLTVTSIFAARFSVCAVAIGSAAVLPLYLRSSDRTWDAVVPSILNQVVMNLSIITAGIPSVHRFLADLQTGQLGSRLPEHDIELSNSRSKFSGSSSRFGRSKADQSLRSSSKPTSSLSDRGSLKLIPPNLGTASAHISTSRGAEKKRTNSGCIPMNRRTEESLPDDSSTSSLRKNGVFQTREVFVEYEYNDGRDGLRQDLHDQSKE